MFKLNSYKRYFSVYEIFLMVIIILYYGGILYTNSFLGGANISDFVNLRSNTIQTASLKSANLPVYYLFTFLYKDIGLSNEFIKAAIAFISLVVIVFSIYNITFYVFNNKLSSILAVILFLYSSLYFSVLFSNSNFIDDANPDALSYSFLMLGIFYWLKDRYNLSSILMGLSFDSHPILPIGLIVAFFIYQFINYKKIGNKNIIASILLFLFATFPVTFSVVKSAVFTIKGSIAQNLDADLIWRYIRFAQPQSSFIDVIPEFHYGLSLYFSSFLILLLLYSYGDKTQKDKYLKLFFLVFTVFAFTIFEILNSHSFRFIPLYNLWFHRFMTYGSVIAYIVLAGCVFYPVNENRISNFLKICLFLLLGFSIFAQQLDADLYMTFWANHFYIFEIVLVYYLYNMYLYLSRNKIFSISMILHFVFLAGALQYYYYIALYDRFNQHALSNIFQSGNIVHFLKVILYRQFEYAWIYGFYKVFFILFAFFASIILLYLVKNNANKDEQRVRWKILRYIAISIISIGLIYSIWKVEEESSSFRSNKLVKSAYAVWTMDDNADGIVKDEKGKHHAFAFNTLIAEGYSGKALYFTGKDSHMKTPIHFKGWSGITLSLWVKPEKKGDGMLSVILDNGHDANSNFVVQSAEMNNPDSEKWIFHCNGVDIPLLIPFNEWTHLILIADAEKGRVKAYSNDVIAGEVKIGKGFIFGDEPLTIGKLARGDERYFKGSIDEVMIIKGYYPN